MHFPRFPFSFLLIALLLSIVSHQVDGALDTGESQIEKPKDWNADTSVDDMASYCADNGCTSSDLTNIPSDKRADFFAHEDTNWNDYSVETLQQYSSELDMNSAKGRNFLRNTDHNTQMQILNNIDQYGGHPLPSDFFSEVMTDQSLNAYWNNYNFGDISKFFSGLTLSESLGAIAAFLDGPGIIREMDDIPDNVMQEALNDQGYDIDNLTYPDDADINLDNGILTINNNTIDLSTFTGGDNTIIVDDDGTLNVNGVAVNDSSNIRKAESGAGRVVL